MSSWFLLNSFFCHATGLIYTAHHGIMIGKLFGSSSLEWGLFKFDQSCLDQVDFVNFADGALLFRISASTNFCLSFLLFLISNIDV